MAAGGGVRGGQPHPADRTGQGGERLGTLEFLQCDYAPAADRLRLARELYEAVGDDHGVAAALRNLGSIAREQGRYAEAKAYHEQGLALWHRLAEPAGVALATRLMSFTAWLEGDYGRSAALAAEAPRRFRELDDPEGTVGALIDLAAATYRGGDPAGAVPLLRESLALARRLDRREASAWANEQLGLIAEALGDRAEAVALLRRSLIAHHELGDRWRTASVLGALAGLCGDALHTCLRILRRALGDAARVRFADGAYHLDPVLTLRYGVGEFRAAFDWARRHGATPAATDPPRTIPATSSPTRRPGPGPSSTATSFAGSTRPFCTTSAPCWRGRSASPRSSPGWWRTIRCWRPRIGR